MQLLSKYLSERTPRMGIDPYPLSKYRDEPYGRGVEPSKTSYVALEGTKTEAVSEYRISNCNLLDYTSSVVHSPLEAGLY